jgi:AcrR family transcriptional regulator
VEQAPPLGRPRTVSDAAILRATLRVIGEHGPARLTLAQVASEVGLAPATLVQRFGSKHGLLLAAARQGVREVDGVFGAAGAAHVSPLAALRAALLALAGDIDSPATLANHLAFLQLDLSDPELRDEAAAHARAVQAHLRRLLDLAATLGELPPCDTATLAQALAAMHSGALLTWAVDGSGALQDWLAARLDLLLDGVLAAL